MKDPFPNPRILDGHGRCACLLVVDTSGSNSGQNIVGVNRGLEAFVRFLEEDAKTRTCVDVGIMTFDVEPRLTREFASPTELAVKIPQLMASGRRGTCLAAAIEEAVERVERRVVGYVEQGYAAYRPWMLLLTDATPTDAETDRRRAAKRLRRAAEELQLMFCAVAVGKANKEILEDLSPEREALQLAPEALVTLFGWLTASVGRITIDREQERPVEFPSNVSSGADA